MKRRVDTPRGDGLEGRIVIVEELVSRDGVDSGLGYTAPVTQVAPAGSNIAGEALLLATDAVAFDAHAVTLSRAEPSATGFVLTRLDLCGRAVASTAYRFEDLLGVFGGDASIVRTGAELRRVVETDAGLSNVRMAEAGGHLMLCWAERRYQEQLRHHVVISGATGELLADQALAFSGDRFVVPRAVGTQPLFSCSANPTASVVMLDDALDPVLALAGSLRLSGGLPAWWLQSLGGFDVQGGHEHLSVSGAPYAPLWSQDSSESGFTQIGELPVSQRVAEAAPVRLLAQVPYGEIAMGRRLVFGNRVLVIGADCNCQGGKLRTMVVWRG